MKAVMYAIFLTIFSVFKVLLAQSSIPLPTTPQLKYEQDEIVALTCLEMETFIGGGNSGCNNKNWVDSASIPSTFNPSNLNISNWVDSYKSLGVKSAVLTVKHGCGFVLWPTKVVIPSTNNLYNYSIQFASTPLNTRDIAKEFATTLSANDIGYGYYYSLATNFYLNVRSVYVQNNTLLPGQIKVTQAQFQQIAIAQLTELFTNYDNLHEFWFDGGTGNQDMVNAVSQIIDKYQPEMAVFNGQQVSKNMIRWIGTESGGTTQPIWSLGEAVGVGDPDSSQYCPACCDTTLQNGDEWFYDSKVSLRTLNELITVYHNTVGNNCVLELDFAIDTTGNVASDQAQRYKEFGDWISSCYGNSLKETNGTISNQNGSLTLNVDTGSFDRIMLKENLLYGQRVRSFEINVDNTNVYESTSIGNKRIIVLNQQYSSPQNVTFIANDFIGNQAYIAKFAVFKACPLS